MLAELLLLALIAARAVEAGAVIRYERDFSVRPVVIAALLVPVVFLLVRVASRQVVVREVPTVVATVIGGAAAQVSLYGLSRHQVHEALSTDNFNSTAEKYGVLAVLRRYEELAPTFPLHARANMPGKILFYSFARQLTTSEAVLAYLVVAVSALGGVLVYLVAKRLFDSRVAGLYSMLFFCFLPARTSFITALNNVTAVFGLLLILLVLIYLDRPTAMLLVAFGLLGYGMVFFDPALVLMGPVVIALVVRQVITRSLALKHVVRLAVVPPIVFAGAHVGMRLAFGFDIFGALDHVSADARRFNAMFRPNYGDWPAANLREFVINAGLVLSLLVLAAFVEMVVMLVRERVPLRRALLDPAWLLMVCLVATTLAMTFAGLNRGEVSRYWLPLAAVMAVIAGALCAQRLPSWVFPVLLSGMVAQIVFGELLLRFQAVVATDYITRVKTMPYDGTYLLDASVIGFLIVAAVLAVRHHRPPEKERSPAVVTTGETERQRTPSVG